MNVPIIGKLHQTEDLVKSATWSYEAGYKAAIDCLERLPNLEALSEEQGEFFDVLISKMRFTEKHVKTLADTAARKQVKEYLKKKAKNQ